MEFLQQDKVAIKTIQKNFCHAKTHLYTDKTKTKNYFIVGSSSLTDAGLGIKDISNIELSIAKHDYEYEFKNLKKWFQELWEKVALEKIELPDKTKVEVKQYIMELSGDVEFKREIACLEETIIYKTLFSY